MVSGTKKLDPMSAPVPTPTPGTPTQGTTPPATTSAGTPVKSVSVDAAVLQKILQSVADSVTQKKSYPKPPAPRVGGVNEVGACVDNARPDITLENRPRSPTFWGT